MKIARSLLHLVTALILLVQGVAVAAGSRAIPQDAEGQAGNGAVHCHAERAVASATAGHPDCCNERCPDMLSCAFFAMATLPPVARLSLPRVSSEAAHEPAARPARAFSGPALRPPIDLTA